MCLAPTEVRCEFLKSSFFVVAVFLLPNRAIIRMKREAGGQGEFSVGRIFGAATPPGRGRMFGAARPPLDPPCKNLSKIC